MLNRTFLFVQCLVLFFPFKASMATIQFRAEIDQAQISLEDTVELKLMIQSEEAVGNPRFHAPDFEVVNELNSTSVQYDSIHGMERRQEITKILQPLKTGLLKITQIRLQLATGQVLTAPDLQVEVVANAHTTGHGLPQHKTMTQNQLPLSQKNRTQRPIFLRAEIERKEVYKGEQVIVSYYLYHAAKVFNLQVDQFPVLSGFLREDLELPIMGSRLESESVSIQGEKYQRALLARYAAYPLQEGKLSLDSISLTLSYENRLAPPRVDDEEDLFFSFFQQMAPAKRLRLTSEPIQLEVKTLPESGKPTNFSGGIGQFQVSAQVSQSEVRENEAISFVLKIAGQGNLSSIQEPRIEWPAGLELYESKGKVHSSAVGEREQSFEFLVIPRTSGVLELPAVELSFFDPIQKHYYHRLTKPISIQVLGAVHGHAKNSQNLVSPSPIQKAALPTATPTGQIWQGLKPLNAQAGTQESRFPIWRLLYLGCAVSFVYLVLVLLFDFLKTKKTRKKLSIQGLWKEFRILKHKGEQSKLVEDYERLNDLVFLILGKKWGTEARLLSKAELKAHFIENNKGLQVEELWKELEDFFRFSERIRFSGELADSMDRIQFIDWVSKMESFLKKIH